MPDRSASSDNPLYWPLDELIGSFVRRELSPVEVVDLTLARIDAIDPDLHAFLGRTDELARAQAREAEAAYRSGNAGPMCGVPVSIKDTFPIEGQITTYGSKAYSAVSPLDSGSVKRLRHAGAVFCGRTNTAEFGQSATTENRFFADVSNPWDVERTTGGSSGGAAASVVAGLASIALGADGGGSIRIPAAFSGLFGFKPTFGSCKNENGLQAMSEFVCPGPLSWNVADARRMLGVLADTTCLRARPRDRLKLGWCAAPEDRPVEPAVMSVVSNAMEELASLGHVVKEFELPVAGWDEIFGPLVLMEEHQRRDHLLNDPEILTDYEVKSLLAARRLSNDDVENARNQCKEFRRNFHEVFDELDFIVTPATATTAFRIGHAPGEISGRRVSRTWGAYPFTAAFNITGNPAATIPCGFAAGLPVGMQVIGPLGGDAELLDLAQDIESLLHYDRSSIIEKWSLPTHAGLKATSKQ